MRGRLTEQLDAAINEAGDTLKSDLEVGPLYGLIKDAASGTAGMLASMRLADIERTVHLNPVSPLVLTSTTA